MSWGFFIKFELASDRLSFLLKMGLEFFSAGLEFFWKRTKKEPEGLLNEENWKRRAYHFRAEYFLGRIICKFQYLGRQIK